MQVNLDAVATLIAEAAAREIAPRFGRLAAADIAEKGPNDLVTVADLAMERELTERLPALLPGSLVVGEESVAANPAVQDLLDGDDPVWIIDPVDGTNNFAHGRPKVAVIVALARRGETIAGWVHDPLTGDTLQTERGAGAWQAGVRLRVAPPEATPLTTIQVSYRMFPNPLRHTIKSRRARFMIKDQLFCAGQEYMRLCRAQMHAAMFWRLKPWDHAAGVLLHQEAGGWSAKLNGEPYRPTDREGGILLAPTEQSWREIHTIFTSSSEARP